MRTSKYPVTDKDTLEIIGGLFADGLIRRKRRQISSMETVTYPSIWRTERSGTLHRCWGL